MKDWMISEETLEELRNMDALRGLILDADEDEADAIFEYYEDLGYTVRVGDFGELFVDL